MISKFFILFFIGVALSKPLTEGEERVMAETKEDIEDALKGFKDIFDQILEGLKKGLLGDVQKILKYCKNVSTKDDIKLSEITFSELMNEIMTEDWEDEKEEYKTFQDYQIGAVYRICTNANPQRDSMVQRLGR